MRKSVLLNFLQSLILLTMKVSQIQKPLSFRSNSKKIIPKINLTHLKSEAHLSNLRHNSQNQKLRKSAFESPSKKQLLSQHQKLRSRLILSPEEKNTVQVYFNKKCLDFTKDQNSNSTSIRNDFPQRQTSKYTSQFVKKSLNKGKNIVPLGCKKQERKFSDNTSEAMKLFQQFRQEHIQEEKLMKLVLNQKEMHRFHKIVAVEEADYLKKVLKNNQLTQS